MDFSSVLQFNRAPSVRSFATTAPIFYRCPPSIFTPRCDLSLMMQSDQHLHDDDSEWQTVTSKPKSQSKNQQNRPFVKVTKNVIPPSHHQQRYPHNNHNANHHYSHNNNQRNVYQQSHHHQDRQQKFPNYRQQQDRQQNFANYGQQEYQHIPPSSSSIRGDFDPEAFMIYREQTLSFLSDKHYSPSLACDSKLMILLCGIPGCGKSTFSRNLISRMPEYQRSNWLHLNQDALKTRHAVLDRTLQGLQEQKHIIIDRCNFDVTQRHHWIELARQCPSYIILCVMLPHFDDISTCSERAFLRGDSDGVHDSDTNWLMVCNKMKQDFVFPTFEEGIDCIYPCETIEDSEKLLLTLCGDGNHSADDLSTTEITTSVERETEMKN